MNELKCGTCTKCCQWKQDVAIRPVLTKNELKRFRNTKSKAGEHVLAANKEGSCVYLGFRGCTVHESRPSQCRAFDCRVLYKQLKKTPFIAVIMQGKEKLEK